MRRRNRCHNLIAIFVPVLLNCLALAVYGQDRALVFQRLTVAEGLSSQGRVTDIFQADDGFIWIGTPDGLNRFDGKQVKQFIHNEDNQQSLSDVIIQGSFFEDKGKNLWFSTYTSLYRHVRSNDAFLQNKIIYLSRDTIEEDYKLLKLDTVLSELWVLVQNKIFIKDCKGLKMDSKLDELPFSPSLCQHFYNADGVQSLMVPKNNNIWLLHYKDNQRISMDTAFLTMPTKSHIRTIYIDDKKNTYIGTEDGLYKITDKKPIEINRVYKGKTIQEIVSIVAFGKEMLLVASAENGVYIYSKNQGKYIGEIKLIEDGKQISFPYLIEKIYLDNQQNLWVSTSSEGIFYGNLNKQKFKAMLGKSETSPTGNSIKSLAKDNTGRLWALTSSGIHILSANSDLANPTNIFLPFDDNIGSPYYLDIDEKQDFYLCSQRGFFKYQKSLSKFLEIPIPNYNKAEGFTYTRILSNGRRLVSSQLTGMYELKGAGANMVLEPFIYLNDKVGYTSIFEDLENVYFYRNYSDIEVFKKRKNGGLDYDSSHRFKAIINDIRTDAKNTCWLATTSGLYRIEKGNGSLSFVREKLIPPQLLNSIEIDKNGDIWLGTNSGLMRFTPGKGYHKYAVEDGLQSQEFNMWSSELLPDDRVAFGGVNGLNIFHPDSIASRLNPPILHFTNWVVNDTGSISSKPEYLPYQSFKYTNRTLTFHFVGIDYSAPEKVRYRYRLSGIDNDTVDGGNNGFARYAQLPAGKYTFNVWAANSDGTWTQTPKSLSFTILHPWYLQWWAIAIWCLLAFALLYSIYRFRIAQIKEQEEIRRLEAEFKQKEAEYKQLAAETETAVLRLQMNPHFIFNSMNSISSYILSKDIDTANAYLGRFARLMRTILNLAAKPRIMVADEIEFLEQYIKTEAMRFEQKFEYKIEVDDAIDPDEVLVPTMILQPFVENAIWHGLSSRQGQGKVRIGFEKSGDSLVCSVEDNGKGRDTAAKEKDAKHESKALKITERRLQLLSEEKARPASIEFIDLKDGAGNPIGTRVVIRLPFMDE